MLVSTSQVRYGKEYLEAVLAHPLSDAGLKEVLEARVDRRVKPAVLVYFPPGSLVRTKAALILVSATNPTISL